MLRRIGKILVAVALGVLPARAAEAQPVNPGVRAAPVIKASFDCTTAKTRIRLLICSDARVAALDLREEQMLRRALVKAVEPDGVRADQDVWVHNRDNCTTLACLSRIYNVRIGELKRWTD